MKIKLAVFFGGKSVEHEVSVITAMQAIASINAERYEVIPVYIDKSNCMYTGPLTGRIESYTDIPKLIKHSARVVPVRDNGKVLLVKYPSRFGKAKAVSEIDVAFPMGHGTNVEDGVLQGCLQFLGLPYVGCDVLSAACGMNKYTQKILLRHEGIPVLDCVKIKSSEYFNDEENALRRISDDIGLPVVIKPVNLGSSIGIKTASDKDELKDALEHAFLFADEVIAEPKVQSLREINVSVLGDKDEAIASECEEPIASDDGGQILSYEDKYTRSSKGSSKDGFKALADSKSSGMASLSRKIPAEIPAELRERIQRLAVKAFQSLGCSGVARIDFLYNNDSGELFYNEINTLPGSLAFYLWEATGEATGLKYPELLDKMTELALKRERTRESINFSFETNILASVRLGGVKGDKE